MSNSVAPHGNVLMIRAMAERKRFLGGPPSDGTLVYVGLYWFMLVYAGLCWFMLAYAGLCWIMVIYVGLCWFMLVYAGLCWFMTPMK